MKIQAKCLSGSHSNIPSFGLPCSSDGKESTCNAGDLGSIPQLGRSHGEGNGNPLQYSCLQDSTDRGAWRATVQGVQRVKHYGVTNTPTTRLRKSVRLIHRPVHLFFLPNRHPFEQILLRVTRNLMSVFSHPDFLSWELGFDLVWLFTVEFCLWGEEFEGRCEDYWVYIWRTPGSLLIKSPVYEEHRHHISSSHGII